MPVMVHITKPKRLIVMGISLFVFAIGASHDSLFFAGCASYFGLYPAFYVWLPLVCLLAVQWFFGSNDDADERDVFRNVHTKYASPDTDKKEQNVIKCFIRDESGATVVEYGLIVVFATTLFVGVSSLLLVLYLVVELILLAV